MLAERRGGIELIGRLIDLGADINHASKNGASVLSRAFSANNAEMVSLLMVAGADTSVLQIPERPIVRIAIEGGSTAALEALKHGGGSIKAFRDGGLDDIHHFVRRGNPEELRILLELGVDPDVKTKQGETVLHSLARCPRCKQAAEIAQELLAAGADVNLPGANGATPLRYAIDKGTESVARVLIAAGANINEMNQYGDSILLYAASKGKPRMVELLSARGARIIQANPDGHYFAAAYINSKAINPLISLGLNPNIPDQHGNRPIMRAAVNGKGEVIRLLIAGGADPDTQSKSGRLVLIEAVRDNKLVSVKALIAGGADVNKKSRKGGPWRSTPQWTSGGWR